MFSSYPFLYLFNVLPSCRRLQIVAITTEGGDGRYPASFLFFPFPLSSRLFGLSNYRLGLRHFIGLYSSFAPCLGLGLGVSFGAYILVVEERKITSVLTSVPHFGHSRWKFYLCCALAWIYFRLGFTSHYASPQAKWLMVVCRRQLVSFGL